MRNVNFTVRVGNRDSTTTSHCYTLASQKIFIGEKEICSIIDGITHLSIGLENFVIVYNKEEKKVIEVVDYNKVTIGRPSVV